MKILQSLLLLLSMCCSGVGFSQNKNIIGNKLVYAEVGGAAIVFSANYDQRFSKTAAGLGFRLGTGFHLQSKFNQSTSNPGFNKIVVPTFPVQLNYVYHIGKSCSAIEAGIGATFTSKRIEIFETDGANENLYWNAALMYRRISTKDHLNWRLGLTPFYNSEKIFLSGGLSIGYQF